MNRINKKILEDIDVLSKAMEKNNLCEVKFSDDIVSYELKKQPKNQPNRGVLDLPLREGSPPNPP